jgi:LDH2 family malate/lactate/ureidoglycolate dehydrogenase
MDEAAGVRVSIGELTEFSVDVLRLSGLPDVTARRVAEVLVYAEARGIGSHGVVRLPIYTSRISRGLIDPAATPTIAGNGAVRSVDAHNCVGALAAIAGMDAAREAAREMGIGYARVFHSNHAGAMGFYASLGARAGFVSIAASNAPLTMAYFGGRTRAVGTNPLAIAVPRADQPPILLDVATSAVARGKIIVAAAEGRPIPEGWAIDVDGSPTTDAHEALAGSVLPFAGPKGSGLAMIIDLLCGVLAGAAYGRHIGDMYEDWTRPQNVGHVFFAIRPEDLAGSFLPAVEDFVLDIRALPPAAGVERVLLPGEIEENNFAESLERGVCIAGSTALALAELGQQHGFIALPRWLTATSTALTDVSARVQGEREETS